MVVAHGAQPGLVGHARGGQQPGDFVRVPADLRLLAFQHREVLAGHAALEFADAEVHGQRGLHQRVHLVLRPFQAVRQQHAHHRGMHRMVVGVVDVVGPLLPHHEEDADVGFALHQGDQFTRQCVDAGGEFLFELQRTPHLLQAQRQAAPQVEHTQHMGPPGLGRDGLLGPRRGAGLVRVHRGAALEQQFQLFFAVHHVALPQQQAALPVANVPRQGLAQYDLRAYQRKQLCRHPLLLICGARPEPGRGPWNQNIPKTRAAQEVLPGKGCLAR
jgi:hypothetical protein